MQPSHRPHQQHSTHDHSHGSLRGTPLIVAIVLTSLMMVVEFAGGLWSHSLALISDAGHMLSDLFALFASLFALRIANKPANAYKTYGYYRAEILVALLNSVLLLGTSVWIVYEAIERMVQPRFIHPQSMLWIALSGLFINLITTFFLHRVRHQNLNLRGAYLHLLSDTLSSVGVVIAAVLIQQTGWSLIDPVLSFFIAGLICFWAGKLLWKSVHVLMESTPQHVAVPELEKLVKERCPEVKGLHDLHVWEITTHMYSLTAHVNIVDMPVSQTMRLTREIEQLLSQRFQIEHVNLQYEVEESG